MLLVREDIDWMLAFFLICFTCGCGLIIYLIVYYSKPENRCVHCYTTVIPEAPGYQQPPAQPYEVQTSQQNIYEVSQNQFISPKKELKASYCPYCGERIEKNARFCSGCGAKII